MLHARTIVEQSNIKFPVHTCHIYKHLYAAQVDQEVERVVHQLEGQKIDPSFPPGVLVEDP